MNHEISINFGAPYMTVSEYAKHTGMKEKTIKDWVSKGLLPIRSKKIAGSKSIVLINNAALTVEALQEKTPTINI